MVVLYIFLALAVLSLIFWQHIRVAFSRISTFKEIKRICDENKIDIKLMNSSYFLAKNKNDSFDFILKVADTVIPVKFYSALSRSASLQIDATGKACIRDVYRKPLSRSGKREVKVIKKYTRLPSMKIKKNIISKKYTYFPIFLSVPEFSSVKVMISDGKFVDIHETDALVAGCRWFDKSMLISLLNLYAKRARDDRSGEKNA